MRKKNYVLKVWPPSDRAHNTRKYKIIKKSPISLPIKLFTLFSLFLSSIYLIIFHWQSLLTIQSWPMSKLLFCLCLIISLNYFLLYIFQPDFEQNIMVAKNIGVSLSTTIPSKCWFMAPALKDQFIPIEDIVDIIIHEGFKGFEVVFYMVIIRRSVKKLIIVFDVLLPRRSQLEVVLRGCRRVLYIGRDDNKLKIPGYKPIHTSPSSNSVSSSSSSSSS